MKPSAFTQSIFVSGMSVTDFRSAYTIQKPDASKNTVNSQYYAARRFFGEAQTIKPSNPSEPTISREERQQKVDEQQLETVLDICALATMLVKLGFDETLQSQASFIEMVNECGFRTVKGLEFTHMGFRDMFRRVLKKNPTARETILDSFQHSFRHVY